MILELEQGGFDELEPFQKGRGRPSSQGPTPKEQELLETVIRWIKEKGYSPTIKELCEAMNVKSASTVHAHMRKLRSKGYITWDPSKPRTISICGFERLVRIRPKKVGINAPSSLSDHAPATARGKKVNAPSEAAKTVKECAAKECAATDQYEIHNGLEYSGGSARSLRTDAQAYASLCRRGVVVPLIGKLRMGPVLFLNEDIVDDIPVPWELVRDDGAFALRVRTDRMSAAGILKGDVIVVRRQEYADSGDIVVAFAENKVVIRRFKNDGSGPVLVTGDGQEECLCAGNFRVLGKVTGVLRSLD